MMKRKNSFIYKTLAGLAIFFFSSISLEISAKEKESGEIVNIEICPDVLINKNFYGFGAETLPWLWTKENIEAGVDEEDIKLNLQRISEMGLPITRIFVPWETWNPIVDYKTFTWESDEMRSLYKILDFYQKTNTSVIVVTVDWLAVSPWKQVKSSAQAVTRLLEYLVKDRGYSCIKFWTLTNEPERTYHWLKKLSFEDYVEIHKLVKSGLQEKNLEVKIIASDDVETQEWFTKSVTTLAEEADVISSHIYAYPQEESKITDFFTNRLNFIQNITFSQGKNDIAFFVCEFGFRGSVFGACTNTLVNDYEYGLYVAKFCIDALNSGVDGALLWCLHQIRLIDEINPEGGRIMRIGLWGYKDEDWRPFPVFYLYQLFTRYINANSRVLKVETSFPGALSAACVEYKGSRSLYVVNLTDKEQAFLVKGMNPEIDFSKYLYTNSNLPFIQNNPYVTKRQISFDDYLEDRIPPRSVILYTNLER